MNLIAMRRYALFSLTKKSEKYIELAKSLSENGILILATEGTYKFLREKGINAIPTSNITGFSTLLSDKVKTLNQIIHSMILCNRENEKELKEIEEYGVIDFVVVNLYETRYEDFDSFLNSLDIGGRSLISSAIKNFKFVTLIVDEIDCDEIINELKYKKEVSYEMKRKLALKAFEYLLNYEAKTFSYFYEKLTNKFSLILLLKEGERIKYGENPHQKAYLFKNIEEKNFEYDLIKGELTYNNYLDINRLVLLLSDLGQNVCAIIKHTNPCGVARALNAKEAFIKAYEADPISAYGGILGISAKIDSELAEIISQHFFDVIVAKDFEEKAIGILSKRKKTRLLRIKVLGEKIKHDYNFKDIINGVLFQEADNREITISDLKVVSNKKPSEEEIKDLIFAWKVVKHVFSNAIVVAKNEVTLGICGGQPNRVSSVRIALENAGPKAKGAVLASDGFFPFRDSIDISASKGISAIIEPGGSIRDEEVVQAANEHNISLVFTGIRCFRH